MNRTAIDDLLRGILSGWCESVADWTPPGQASSSTCTTCMSSLLRSAVDFSEWPHDLAHQLANFLETATLQIYDALDGPPQSYEGVRAYVTEWALEHSDDLMDVVHECVAPRLDVWIDEQLERGMAEAGLAR